MTEANNHIVEAPCDVEPTHTLTIVDIDDATLGTVSYANQRAGFKNLGGTANNSPDWWDRKFPKQPEPKKMGPVEIRRAHYLLQQRQTVDAIINDIDNNKYVNTQDVIREHLSDDDLKKAILPVLQKRSADFVKELKELGVDLSF